MALKSLLVVGCALICCAFFREEWIIYHGKETSEYTYRGRTARAQKFTWRTDGTPDFGRPIPRGVPLRVPSGEGKSRAPKASYKNRRRMNNSKRLQLAARFHGSQIAWAISLNADRLLKRISV